MPERQQQKELEIQFIDVGLLLLDDQNPRLALSEGPSLRTNLSRRCGMRWPLAR